MEEKRFTLRMPKETHDALLEVVYLTKTEEGRSLSINTIILEALEGWLEAHNKSKGTGRGAT